MESSTFMSCRLPINGIAHVHSYGLLVIVDCLDRPFLYVDQGASLPFYCFLSPGNSAVIVTIFHQITYLPKW